MAKKSKYQDDDPEIETEGDETAAAELPTVRCYSRCAGYRLVVRNDKLRSSYDADGRRYQEIVAGGEGYTAAFHLHRCDMPETELQAALAKRNKFFVYDWVTGPELAKRIDNPDDDFVLEMYRRSAVSSNILAGDSKKEVSQMSFLNRLRNELRELGYFDYMKAVVADLAEKS